MKRYIFSFKNVYGEAYVVVVLASKLKDAREKVASCSWYYPGCYRYCEGETPRCGKWYYDLTIE